LLKIALAPSVIMILLVLAACTGQNRPITGINQTDTASMTAPSTPHLDPTEILPTPWMNGSGIPIECLNQDERVPKDLYDWHKYGDLGCAHFSPSPDGKILAYSELRKSPDGKRNIEIVKVLDLQSGESHIIYSPKADKVWVWDDLAWSEDGRLHFTVSPISDWSTALIYDPKTDSLVEATPSPTAVPPLLTKMQSGYFADQLTWSPGGKNLAAAGCPDDRCFLQWINVSDLSVAWKIDPGGVITILDIDPTGKTIAALIKKGIQNRDDDGRILQADKTEIWLFRTSDGAVIRYWDAEQAQSVRFDSSGSRIGTAGGTAVLWDVNTGAALWRLAPGQVVHSLGRAKMMRQTRPSVSLGGGKCEMENNSDANFDLVAFSQNQPVIFLSANDGSCGYLVEWDMQANRLVDHTGWEYQTADNLNHDNSTYTHVNLALDFSADTNMLLLATKGMVRTWNLGTNELIEQGGMDSYVDTAPGIAFSPDGKKAALWGLSNNYQEHWPLELYDIQARKSTNLVTSMDPENLILTAAFSRDGERLASVDKSGSIKLWDTRGVSL
jgi:WD40 repeat protein